VTTPRLLVILLALLASLSLTRCSAPVETGEGATRCPSVGGMGGGAATAGPSTGPGHFCFAGDVGGHCYHEDGG